MDRTSMLRFARLSYPSDSTNVRTLPPSACHRSISPRDSNIPNMKIPVIFQQKSIISCESQLKSKEGYRKKIKAESNNSSAKRQNIMIVDDEDDINLLFTMLLCDEGYNVEAFTDPDIAIMKFEDGFYDLLIVDILMPKMNGFELYERLRQFDNEVKVCFLTAGEINYEQFKKAASFPEITTEDCFIKIPIENNVLIKKVKNILSIDRNCPK